MVAKIELTPTSASTEILTSTETEFEFTRTPWEGTETEYDRFETLAKKLVNTPKSDDPKKPS